ncbi:MAG: TonB-dependent receptor, partial [Halioglobus sp.]
SEGYRAGGTNRARGEPTLPVQYESDLLKNYEGGIKSRWLDGRLQVNVIAYHQKWEDMQLELTDPSSAFGEPFQTVIANVGDAEVEGVDLDTSFLFNDNLTVGLVATHLFTAEIPDEIAVFDERAPDDFALFIPGGTQLPLASKDNMAAYAEYSTPVNLLGGSDAFLRLQYSYTGSSWNRLVDNDGDPTGTGYGGRAKNPSYDTFDVRFGVNNSTWEISMYVDNLTDERQTILRDTAADLFWGRDRIVTGQPRTLGLNVRRYFN